MRLRIKQFVTIARMTAKEIARQPVTVLLTTVSLLFIALMPFLITHTLGQSLKVVRDSALAVHLLSGLLLGGYAANVSFAQEIGKGTAAAILSKPINRGTFFLAKVSGVAVVVLLFSAIVSTATLMSARAAMREFRVDWWAAGPLLAVPLLAYIAAALDNYFFHKPFTSSALIFMLLFGTIAFIFSEFVDASGQLASFGQMYDWRIPSASLLISAAVLILTSLSITLATRLAILPTLIICVLIFLLGLMSDYLFARHVGSSSLATILYYTLPNWQHFWIADGLTRTTAIPWGYIGGAFQYAAFYILGTLSLGILFFRKREIK